MPIEPRSTMLSIRLTKQERKEIEKAATLSGLHVSEWIRREMIPHARQLINIEKIAKMQARVGDV